MTDSPIPQSRPRRATVAAPGSIGNVGPGLDVLGLAVAGLADRVTAEPVEGGALVLRDPGHASLPSDPAQHAVTLAADAVRRRAGESRFGAAFTVEKGLPLAGGQGGSAASAAAGAGAMNALLGSPLTPLQLVEAALEVEAAVAGRHADNLGPAILGGLVLVRSMDPLDCIRLPVPAGLHITLVRPRMQLRTAEGRGALPREVPREVAIHQMAQTAGLVAAACLGDLVLLGRCIDDRLAEPARAPLLPGFAEAKAAAMGAGALGCSISGSGPTIFALSADRRTASYAAAAMVAAYAHAGLTSDARVTEPDVVGLTIEME